MATKGTVTIYLAAIRAGDPVEYRWQAEYAYLDGESVTVRYAPEVGRHASAQQLRYHADKGLSARMAESGEPYAPQRYEIRRPTS